MALRTGISGRPKRFLQMWPQREPSRSRRPLASRLRTHRGMLVSRRAADHNAVPAANEETLSVTLVAVPTSITLSPIENTRKPAAMTSFPALACWRLMIPHWCRFDSTATTEFPLARFRSIVRTPRWVVCRPGVHGRRLLWLREALSVKS